MKVTWDQADFSNFHSLFLHAVHQNISLPSESRKEPDLWLRENLVEVNDKEGGEGKKVENFARLYILLYELQTKNMPKNNLHF